MWICGFVDLWICGFGVKVYTGAMWICGFVDLEPNLGQRSKHDEIGVNGAMEPLEKVDF